MSFRRRLLTARARVIDLKPYFRGLWYLVIGFGALFASTTEIPGTTTHGRVCFALVGSIVTWLLCRLVEDLFF